MAHLLIAVLCALALQPGFAKAQDRAATPDQPIAYSVDLDPGTLSSFTVTMAIPEDVRGEIRLALPAWTPGRWRLRPWNQRLESVRALDGKRRPVPVTRMDETVRIEGAAPLEVTFTIGLTRQQDSVHRYFTETGALLEGARTFPYLLGAQRRPCRVFINGPASWKVASTLPPADRPRRFTAPHYPALLDAAFLCGDLRMTEFSRGDATYRIVLDRRGRVGDPNLAKLHTPFEKLAAAHDRMSGPLPTGRWTMLMVETADGTRHHDEGVTYGLPENGLAGDLKPLMLAASESLARARLRRRVQPAAVLAPDFQKRIVCKELWFTEGWPRWAARVALLHAGAAPATWRADLARTILEHRNHLLTGRVSPEEASEACSGAARDLSPSLCGHLLSALLDIRARTGSDGQHTLFEAVRALAETLDGKKPFTRAALEKALQEAGGGDAANALESLATGHEPLPWDAALKSLGLKFLWVRWTVADPGLRCAELGGQVFVSDLPRRSALRVAGLREGDRIHAVDQKRVKRAIDVDRAIARQKPGRKIRFDIRRDGKPKSIRMTLGAAVAVSLPVDERGALVVLEALPPGPARDAGLREGDVLVKIGKTRIGGARELRQALRRLKGSSTAVTIQRAGKKKMIKLKTPRRITWRGELEIDRAATPAARRIRSELEVGSR